MPMRLQGKSALVTGAASGFGAEIARHFAREGANVTLMDLNGEGARAVADEIGASAVSVKGDVTSRADIEAAIAAAVEHGGKLDILVNNAGWTHRNKPLLEVTEEEFDCHPEHRFDRRHPAAARPHLVQWQQGRGEPAQPVARSGTGAAEDPRQLRRPGHGGDRPAGELHGAARYA
jgi:nucleoside-diphosphate-sugar epimerase